MVEEQEASRIITTAVEALSGASGLSQITGIVAEAARRLTNSDGAAFVLRENDKCFYVDEVAISPLWKGSRFPLEACISGWCMTNREVVSIKDVYKDARLPQDAYRPTFVKSLCMIPIRTASPLGAIGNYWSYEYEPLPEEIQHLQILANCASVAIENYELKQAIDQRDEEKNILSVRHGELEVALHTLVHDLRNPISSIVAFSNLLQTYLGDSVDARASSFFESINRTANRVNQTIGQMLALYKLSGDELSKELTDLSIIAMEIEAQMRVQEPDRSVQVTIEDSVTAYADPLLIRLVMENLFLNAYKFTGSRDKPQISFGRLSSSDREQVFFVKDNGVGFDSKDASKLFKPLSRLHDANLSGTGLGLCSVSQIIVAHGGTVRAEGEIGKGAVFCFSLPNVNATIGARCG